MIRQEAFIGGKWLGSSRSGTFFEVINPATGEPVGKVPNCGMDEAKTSISDAEKAAPMWAALTAYERGKIIRGIADAMRSEGSVLARVLTQEQGKPLVEAEKEIHYAADFFEWFAEEGKRAYGEVIPHRLSGQRLLTLRQPIGTSAAITPWNFPSAMMARKAAASLAAGCCMIVKPARETPFSALAIAAIAEKAGLPAGVLSVITGDSEPIARALMEAPHVRKLSFTGSTEVGRRLMGESAPTLKKLTLELGGNAALVVCEDANIEKAVEGAMFAKFRNAGQTCIAINRFIVHEKMLEAFTEHLAAQVRKLKVGNGLDPDTDIGPLISLRATAKVGRLVDEALRSGAKIRLGSLPDLQSRFVYPIILTDVTPAMSLSCEEVFGPVIPIMSARSDEEAIALANATEYGLAGYLYSENASRLWRLGEMLQCGIVGLNETRISQAQAPFGGVKQSGFGREGGRLGLEEYLAVKYVCLGL